MAAATQGLSGSRPGRRGVGYLLVGLVSTAIGVLGVYPFVIAPYALTQLVLAPLGLAEVDPTNNDGVGVTVFFGVLVPLALVIGWGVAVRGLSQGWRLRTVAAWSLGVAALVAPTAVFVVAQLT